MTHDDLYANTWDTNFGTNPFEIEPPNHEQDDVHEYASVNYPPSLEISKKVGTTVEQTTAPKKESPKGKANNEIDIKDDQQNLQPTHKMDVEISPDENQKMLSMFKKKNYPQIHVVKYTIYDLTQTLSSRIHTITKNRRLQELKFTSLLSFLFFSSVKWINKDQKCTKRKSRNSPLRNR